MLSGDLLRLAGSSLLAHPLRSVLTSLGIAIGIFAVVMLTSLGEGLHRFVLAEFTQFGTNLISVTPGKTTTFGGSGAIISTVRPLTIDDAQALERLPQVLATVPLVQGNAAVEAGPSSRRSNVYGVGPGVPEVWKFQVAAGRFLPADDPRASRALAVLGSKLRQELFGERNPLGAAVRIGGFRYRVIGVLAPKGQFLGFDLDDSVFIPAGRALEMFNRDGLMQVDLLYSAGATADGVAAMVRRQLLDRHGHEDFTITTQQQMLDVLGSVLNVLTFAVGALGGISLLVGAVGVLTIMTIAVNERTGEIGLLRAIGATRRQVLGLFLAEAVVVAGAGGLVGLLAGLALARSLAWLLPALPVHTPLSFAAVAVGLAALIGIAAGVLPARRAAGLDPLEALRAE